MELHLLDGQEAELNQLSAQTGRRTDDLLQEAVSKLLAHNERIKQQVQIGVDEIG